MSLLSDIKNLLNKYLKNKTLVIAGAFILWRFVKNHKSGKTSEKFSERISIIEDNPNLSHSIIFDERTQKYILIHGVDVFSADNKDELYKILER